MYSIQYTYCGVYAVNYVYVLKCLYCALILLRVYTVHCTVEYYTVNSSVLYYTILYFLGQEEILYLGTFFN